MVVAREAYERALGFKENQSIAALWAEVAQVREGCVAIRVRLWNIVFQLRLVVLASLAALRERSGV